jgi:electron transfer flavoprotein beta subunit
VKVTVLIAGVQDPKWPVKLAEDGLPLAQADRQIMSPFDEAALEVALRIRDARPETAITVHVAGGAAGERIARAVAAFNPASVATVHLATPWDQGAVAQGLAQLCGEADLVLIGREFGDFDDGLVPPLLACKLGVPFAGRVQAIETRDELRLLREAGSFEERYRVAGRMVASVTNDRRTRLRKPLMKNVMLARQASIASSELAPPPSPQLRLVQFTQRTASRTTTDCKLIQGPVEQQAAELATLLWEARA